MRDEPYSKMTSVPRSSQCNPCRDHALGLPNTLDREMPAELDKREAQGRAASSKGGGAKARSTPCTSTRPKSRTTPGVLNSASAR